MLPVGEVCPQAGAGDEGTGGLFNSTVGKLLDYDHGKRKVA